MLLAAVLAVLAPSLSLARHSDLLLAGLVLVLALGMPLRELSRLRAHAAAVAVLALGPLPALAALGWVLGRPFAASVRDGLLGVGLASSEVASVGLVALAGFDAAIALGVLAGSLVAAALLGPIGLALLGSAIEAEGAARTGVYVGIAGSLLARFALVVLAPLAGGIALASLPAAAARLPWPGSARVRTLGAGLGRPGRPAAKRRDRAREAGMLDRAREGVAALLVGALVYAALSGVGGSGGRLGAPALAAALFLLASSALALLWARLARHRPIGIPGAFAIGMRDFAVAAALATQAFGPRAGVVPGVYGVFMLLAGSGAASVWRARRAATPGRAGGS